MATIHPTALITPGAELHESVEVGPYCVVGRNARIGENTKLMGHVWVDGCTTLGEGCTVYPFACLGTLTQDKKHEGGFPRVEIGDRTTIREYVTVNTATKDGDVTRVGNDCLLMAYSHVAHDCVVGDKVIIANGGSLAGHVTVEDRAIIGGLTGIHQFVRIGQLSIVGGCSKVTQDVPPYMMADGHPLQVRGINRVGLDRSGISRNSQRILKQAFRCIYRRDLTTSNALEIIAEEVEPTTELNRLVLFIRESNRGITK